MKKIILICLLAVFACNVFAQTQNVDSLINVLETQQLTPDEQLLLYKDICLHYLYSDTEQYKIYSDKGLALAEKEKNKALIAIFYANLSIYFFHTGDYDEALKHAHIALEMEIERGNEKQQGVLYSNIALMYSMQGDLAKELEYYHKALPIFEKNDNKKNFITLLVNIGTTYRTLGDFDRTLKYFDRANALAEETNYAHGKLLVAYGYACVCYDKNEYDSALVYYSNAIELSKATNNKDFEALCAQSLSELYFVAFGDNAKAEEFAKESLIVAEEFGNPFRIRGAYSALARVHLNKKQNKEAEDFAMKAWQIDSINMDITPNLAIIISKANIRLGNKDKAEYFFNKYIEINGEKNMKNIQEILVGMEVKYEIEKKELKIGELEKRQTLYAWIVGTSIIAVLLVLGLLYFRQRLNKQKIKQLEQEKQLIASQAVIDGETAERTRLARDLHDGLGGMLSAVKLNLRDMKGYSFIESTDVSNFNRAVEMLDLSIAELRRVSHHIMPDLSSGLKMPLEDFCRSIPEAKFRFFGDDSHLDNRLKITVYRCAHELINNAIKHARATEINVQLVIDGNLISLSVQDDGIGFDVDRAIKGLGLENVRARAAIYNGKVNIYSSPEKGGTEVNVEIELA